MNEFTNQTEFVVVTCGKCHVQYAMTKEMYQKRHNDHESFYCPNGHCRCFTADSELDKLKDNYKRLMDDYQTKNRQRGYFARSNTALRGHITRLRNKIKEATNESD